MNEERKGGIFALFSMSIWGVAPVYFVAVGFAQPFEVLAHRIVWSLPLLCLILSLMRTWSVVLGLSRREYCYLFASSVCLAVNWFTFIQAIALQKIVETSLGYFITPLVSIFLGWIFLREHLRPLQWVAVLMAVFGVSWELYVERLIPAYGLALAFSFGIYGLLRKQVNLPAAAGLFVECSLLIPLALVYLIFFGESLAERTEFQLGFLMLGGVITVVPLLFFTAAATRLPLVILGIFQYIAPSLSLVIAVVVFGEIVSPVRWFTLGFIWFALLIFSIEGFYCTYRSSLRGADDSF